jgi:predicted esterase
VSDDPHASQPVLRRGPSARDARLGAILIHGRGASADDIFALAAEFDAPDILYLAPQAAGNTWYPYSFLAPIPQNEPDLSSGLRRIERLVGELNTNGIPSSRIVILGFSQGACLTLEFAARHAQQYAAIVGLSGGVVGPAGTPRNYRGSLDGTPVFLGCSDVDPHIPLERVHESAMVFRGLGGNVDERIYPGMAHTVNGDEIDAVRMLLGLAQSSS